MSTAPDKATREEREGHIRRAWGNLKFEGVKIDDEVAASAQRYIDGDITIEQHVQECLDHAKKAGA